MTTKNTLPTFDREELSEIYGALEHWNPSDREEAAAAHRAFWKCGKAFGHPWALKFATADEAVAEHMKDWVAP